jgi:hypothetical protein
MLKHIGEIVLSGELLKITCYVHTPILFQNGLNYTPIDFYEQVKHIQGSQTKFTFSPRPLNSLLAILKNILELEEWTYRNQEFNQ